MANLSPLFELTVLHVHVFITFSDAFASLFNWRHIVWIKHLSKFLW